jgi:positive regulator of sigma E activity
MTQDAIVYRRLANDMAEVVVTRSTACGSNCGNCESCIFQNEIKTVAKNLNNAGIGQRVIIESKSSRIYGAALMVYILPMVLALFGYFLAYALGAGEGLSILSSFIGLGLGAVILVVTQRKKMAKDPITFDIIAFQDN